MNPTPTMLGSYPVERELGRGGMGVVYLARDPRLNRPLAIKVLSTAFARHPEYLARFEREAKLLATLTHPNVASIYGVEETPGGEWLLLLEYVPGETLAERLERGPMLVEDALDCCRQIAVALEAAHEAGVIHRDLKPGNVKITPDGQVKVLDFGLAKGTTASPSDVDLALSPTYVDAPTAVGVILGTAGYMSPEQARGKVVDRRTDIWSFGCVLYECLTGAMTFGGETASDTIARILEREPDWAALPPQTPVRVRELLQRCLEKDPKKRQRDIGDVRIELDAAIASRAWARPAATSSTTLTRMRPLHAAAAVVACIALGAAIGVAGWTAWTRAGRVDDPLRGPVRLAVNIPPSVRATAVSLTPDGRTLIVAGYARKPDGTEDPRRRLYTRGLHEEELKPVPGAEDVVRSVVSRDGRWVAFLAAIPNETQQRLSKVPIDGNSPPVALLDWEDTWRSFVWLDNGDFLICADTGESPRYYRLPANGGAPLGPTKIDMADVKGFVNFTGALPGDGAVLFEFATWGARGYQNDIWVLDLATNKARQLLENAGNAEYSETGHLVFSRGDTLMAAPFDATKFSLTGEVVALTSGLRGTTWGHSAFQVSKTGTLIYASGGRVGGSRRLVIVDGKGEVTPFNPEQRAYDAYITASRDGRQALVIVPNQRGTYETWLATANKPGLQRLLPPSNADISGTAWSANGTHVAYTRQALDAEDGVYIMRVDAIGNAIPVVKTGSPETFLVAGSWTPDDRGLIVVKLAAKGDILYVPVPTGGKPGTPVPLRTTAADEQRAQLSPDGKLLAFVSDESGRPEAYVATFEDGRLTSVPIRVSTDGSYGNINWAGDSRRLFYADREAEAALMVEIDRAPLSASAPVRAFELRKLRIGTTGWDILPDGRLLAIQRAEGEGDDAPRTFLIVLNWVDELKQRLERR